MGNVLILYVLAVNSFLKHHNAPVHVMCGLWGLELGHPGWKSGRCMRVGRPGQHTAQRPDVPLAEASSQTLSWGRGQRGRREGGGAVAEPWICSIRFPGLPSCPELGELSCLQAWAGAELDTLPCYLAAPGGDSVAAVG